MLLLTFLITEVVTERVPPEINRGYTYTTRKG